MAVLHVTLCASFEQHLHDLDVAVRHSLQQRGRAVIVHGVDVRAGLDQRLDHLCGLVVALVLLASSSVLDRRGADAAFVGREVQRSPPHIVLQVDVDVGEELAHVLPQRAVVLRNGGRPEHALLLHDPGGNVPFAHAQADQPLLLALEGIEEAPGPGGVARARFGDQNGCV